MTGAWTCDAYDRIFLGIPGEIQTARILSIMAALLWFVSILTSLFGLECVTWRSGQIIKVTLL